MSEIYAQRHLAWHACRNVRDLGGLPVASGGTTRWRAVVRADDLCRLSEEGQAELQDYGIRTIIDLRGHFELDQGRHPYRPPYRGGLDYLHLPPTGDETEPLPAIVSAPSIQEIYVNALRLRRRQYGAMLTAAAQAPDGGIVVHCVSGKDRTGLAVALLLALVGVPDAVIAEDYALSAARLRQVDVGEPTAAPRGRVDDLRHGDEPLSPPEAVLTALRSISERHGSVEGYMQGAGVTVADLRRLRAILVGA